jgi:hypothetical protein
MVANKCLLLGTKNYPGASRERGSTDLDQTASETAERHALPKVPVRGSAEARGDSLLPIRQGRR